MPERSRRPMQRRATPAPASFRPALVAALAAALLAAGCTAPSEGTLDDKDIDTVTTTPSPTGPVGGSDTPATPTGAPPATPSGAPPASTTPSPAPVVSGPTGPTQAAASSAATSPVVVRFELDDARAFFGAGSPVRVVVTGDGFDHVRAGLALPEGVDVVDGDLAYEGALEPGRAIELQGTVRATAPGTYDLRAWAEASVAAGSRIAPSVSLRVEGDEGAAAVRESSSTPHAFQVTLDPGADPRDVTLTMTSTVGTAARIALALPTGATLAAGTGDAMTGTAETLTLEPDELVMRALRLELPTPTEEGTWTLTASLYPDAAVDGRVFRAQLYYTWQNGAWSVRATPPG